MGGMTLEVNSLNAMSTLREQFMAPAVDAGDLARVAQVRLELTRIKERIALGDDRIYSETLGCWIRVIP